MRTIQISYPGRLMFDFVHKMFHLHFIQTGSSGAVGGNTLQQVEKKRGVPDVVFTVVFRIILVELADGGGHVEEARVEEHEQIARHAGSDQAVVVVSFGPPVIREPPFLGEPGGNQNTHHSVQVLPLEGVLFGAVLPLRRRNRFKTERRLLRPMPFVLVLWGRLRLVGAEVDVSVGLKKCGQVRRVERGTMGRMKH